jgi:hypothetical protein
MGGAPGVLRATARVAEPETADAVSVADVAPRLANALRIRASVEAEDGAVVDSARVGCHALRAAKARSCGSIRMYSLVRQEGIG